MKYVAIVGAAWVYYRWRAADHRLVEYVVWLEYRLYSVDISERYVVEHHNLRWFECCDS